MTHKGSKLLITFLFCIILTIGSNGIAESVSPESVWVFVAAPSEEDAAYCRSFDDKTSTLKILFGDRAVLGAYFYELARHAGDVPLDMTQEKFSGGVNATHYDMQQIVQWASQRAFNQKEEHPLITLLIKQGFLEQKTVMLWPTGRYRHLVAVSTGKKRSLATNLMHEMLHVNYDEDSAFREDVSRRWGSLSEEERKAFVDSIKSYKTSDDRFVMEEWGVRQAETQATTANAPPISTQPEESRQKTE